MPEGERDTGTGLQIPLECQSAFLVGELDDNIQLPTTVTRSVRTMSRVVGRKKL